MMQNKWNLVADIGGTNARFGVVDYHTGKLSQVRQYGVAQYSEFMLALKTFLGDIEAQQQWDQFPKGVCLAVACAVDGDRVSFTNSPWNIDRQEVIAALDGAEVYLINDFTAVGYAVAELTPGDWRQVGEGGPVSGRSIAVLGAGTGLGVCSLVPVGTGYQVVEGEGGHVDFSPVDDREIAILKMLREQFGRVSVERLASGDGILNIYHSLCRLEQTQPHLTAPADVTKAALEGEDSLAREALHVFCRVLGGVAGNLALTLGAKGGVYIAGGIVPRFIEFFEKSDFRSRFEAKGRFKDYLKPIPTRVVVKDNLGLLGAAKKLSIMEL